MLPYSKIRLGLRGESRGEGDSLGELATTEGNIYI